MPAALHGLNAGATPTGLPVGRSGNWNCCVCPDLRTFTERSAASARQVRRFLRPGCHRAAIAAHAILGTDGPRRPAAAGPVVQRGAWPPRNSLRTLLAGGTKCFVEEGCDRLIHRRVPLLAIKSFGVLTDLPGFFPKRLGTWGQEGEVTGPFGNKVFRRLRQPFTDQLGMCNFYAVSAEFCRPQLHWCPDGFEAPSAKEIERVDCDH